MALSADGNTALIGEPLYSHYAGTAWVFTRSEGTWTQQAELTAGTEEKDDGDFGDSVALSSNGNVALIGARGADEGAAFVFTRSDGEWTRQTVIKGYSGFGESVALSSEGNIALIGGSDGEEGAAWVFTHSGGGWTESAMLTGEEEIDESIFGASVALSSEGNTALIGGYDDDGGEGAAWIFTNSGGVWKPQGKKLTEEVYTSNFFGYSVALSSTGNTALIGAEADNNGEGSAYVFTRSSGKWTRQAKFLSSVSEETDVAYFGASVALSSNGDTALVGASFDAGAAYVFTYSGGKWKQIEKLTGKDEGSESKFGTSVALSSEGNTALVGSPFEKGLFEDEKEAGAAWVFAS